MAIASLNINGLRSHFDEVNLLIQRLGIHILALNETKLDNSIPNELIDISGYQEHRRVRLRHGGGVSIYIRNSINFKPRDDIPAEGLELICIDTSLFWLLRGIGHLGAPLAPLIGLKKSLPT